MTKEQNNYYRMVKAATAFLDSNTNTTSTLPIFAASVTELKEKTTELENIENARQTVKEGKSEIKAKEREELEKIVFKISSVFYMYGRMTGSKEITNVFDLNSSDLSRFREAELVRTAEVLHEETTKVSDQLADYNITTEMLTQLEKEKNDFVNAAGLSTTDSSQSVVYTAKVKEIISAIRDILENEIDKLVDFYKDGNPDFYNGYYNSRNIIDR
ncbi:MAG: hypothetical protein K9J12_01455 [Melioribacteraceae bacterium]|nr:hypothetical protein [Melioribacteraceae bacterium]MCF8265739.1 hypothetical protein [Melioribacteraceae bacterium]MCF8432754.1 hypothetical protein [Melioribacteraceae bacterium]